MVGAMSSNSFEAQARELSAQARLGSALSAPASFSPPPLKYYAGSIVLVLLGLAAGAFVFMSGARGGGGIALAVTSALCLAAGGFFLVRRGANRGTVQAFEHGLVVVRGGRSASFPFDEMQGLQIAEKEQLDNGVRAGVRRRVRLRSRTAQTAFDAFARDGAADPVGMALQSALDQGAARVSALVGAGGLLAGKGWTLDAEGLRRGRGPAVPLDDLARVAIFQGQVRLWRGSEPESFMGVPAGSVNARLLHALVSRRVAGKPAHPLPDGELGRVLFTKKTSTLVLAVLVLFSLGLLAGGVAALGADRVAGGALIGGGVLATVGAMAAVRGVFRAHEGGIVRRTLFGTRSMPYSQIERLTFSAIRQYHNGAYMGTSLTLKCTAADGRKVKTSATVRGSDDGLESLRDHIARVVAQRLRARLGTEREVPWAGGIRLMPDGLRFRRKKFFGQGEEVQIAWGDLRYSIDAGSLHVFEPGASRASVTVSCAAENFYPGLVLLQTLPGESARS
jgi:hypothetical protein